MLGFLQRKTHVCLLTFLPNNSFCALFHESYFSKTIIRANVSLIPLSLERNSSWIACVRRLHHFVIVDSYPAIDSECER